MTTVFGRMGVAAAICVLSAGAQVGAPGPVQAEVMRVDEAYRAAKLGNDLNALQRILAGGFYEMNQNGHGRNKAETLELWREFRIQSLTTDGFEVRSSGNTAVVTGTQTENGSERMLFSRTYVRNAGAWQLLDSIQFRNPEAVLVSGAQGGEMEQVFRVDEAYRMAKLKNDVEALRRVLADGFYEMNQNGHGRNKDATLTLWKDFHISSLKTNSADVRVNGDTAVVTGVQTEDGGTPMLFSRTYVREAGSWRLLNSLQFTNPGV